MLLRLQQDTRDGKKNNSTLKGSLAALPLPSTVSRSPQHPASPVFRRRHTPGPPQGCRQPSSAISFRAPEPSKRPDPPLAPRGGLRSEPRRRALRSSRQLGASTHSGLSLFHSPQRSSGPGLTSPPTPSGSASHSVCRTLGSCLHTFSRRLEARSLCGGP